MGNFIQGSLGFANIVLALFVIFFAVSFLARTRNNKDRKPWIFLFIAVAIFFVIQIFKVLELTGHINLGAYTFYLDSMFIAIVLFTFIFQYNLILSSELIQIKRKSDDDLDELNDEINTVDNIEKKLKAEENDISKEERELEKFTKKAKRSTKKILKDVKKPKPAIIRRKH